MTVISVLRQKSDTHADYPYNCKSIISNYPNKYIFNNYNQQNPPKRTIISTPHLYHLFKLPQEYEDIIKNYKYIPDFTIKFSPESLILRGITTIRQSIAQLRYQILKYQFGDITHSDRYITSAIDKIKLETDIIQDIDIIISTIHKLLPPLKNQRYQRTDYVIICQLKTLKSLMENNLRYMTHTLNFPDKTKRCLTIKEIKKVMQNEINEYLFDSRTDTIEHRHNIKYLINKSNLDKELNKNKKHMVYHLYHQLIFKLKLNHFLLHDNEIRQNAHSLYETLPTEKTIIHQNIPDIDYICNCHICNNFKTFQIKYLLLTKRTPKPKCIIPTKEINHTTLTYHKLKRLNDSEICLCNHLRTGIINAPCTNTIYKYCHNCHSEIDILKALNKKPHELIKQLYEIA